jgi:hypothetical protein
MKATHLYPATPECESYLQMRKKFEESENKRLSFLLLSAMAGTSSTNNAANSAEFREMTLAYQDCQMSALNFFHSQKHHDQESNPFSSSFKP